MIASCQDPLCGSGRGVQHYSSSVPAAGRRRHVCNDFNGLGNSAGGTWSWNVPILQMTHQVICILQSHSQPTLLARAGSALSR